MEPRAWVMPTYAHRHNRGAGTGRHREMPKADSYIHGTEPAEQRRLAALNRMTNDAFVRFLNVGTGARVLEVGSGLGILAAAVASAGGRGRGVRGGEIAKQNAGGGQGPGRAHLGGGG